MNKKVAIAIVGPTGTGKSEAALDVAQALSPAEILSIDSMQVYRGMDIGTAKLPVPFRREIPHHLLDIIEPDQSMSVSLFREMAIHKMEELDAEGKRSILVGGTGLYLNAIQYELNFGTEGADELYRTKLKEIANNEEGKKQLYEQLREIDPQTADKLHYHDINRVIRALEIYHLTGKRKSDLDQIKYEEGPFHVLIYGLTLPRPQLYRRLDHRTEKMLQQGWIEEVQKLIEAGIDFCKEGGAGQAIGYAEIASYLRGKLSYDTMADLIKKNTRRYAKRQWTWFRHLKQITWFDESEFNSVYERNKALICRIKSDLLEF